MLTIAQHRTPAWILSNFEWQTLPEMDQLHDEFNEEFGTDFEFLLRPAE